MEKSRSSLDPVQKSPAQERSKIEKIQMRGEVKQKRNIAGEFIDAIVNESDGTPRTEYIYKKVIVPAISKTIFDICKNVANAFLGGVELVLFGGRSASSRSSPSEGYRYSYVDYTKPSYTNTSYQNTSPPKVKESPDSLLFDYEEDAKSTRDKMLDLIDACGRASIADLYAMLEKPSSYTDDNYGWDDLRTATIVNTRNGWLLRFPRPKYLGRDDRY